MRQRVMIAMALCCEPDILIADEPTTALDVTIQAQILQLMDDLKKKLDTAVILITHDLGVVAQVCDHVCVMYAGRVIEKGSVHRRLSHRAFRCGWRIHSRPRPARHQGCAGSGRRS